MNCPQKKRCTSGPYRRLFVHEEESVRQTVRACGAHRGTVPGRRRNRTCAVAHGTGGAGGRVKTRGCGRQRMFVRHGKARRPREENQTHHTEIWQERRDRRAARHSKRADPGAARREKRWPGYARPRTGWDDRLTSDVECPLQGDSLAVRNPC